MNRPARLGSWLRAAAIGALVLALAQPTVARPGGTFAVLIDVSDSVGDTALAALASLDATLPGNTESYLTASETARVTTVPSTAPPFLRTSTTDLARAVQVAVAGGAGRLLLVSDGISSEGPLLASLPD